MANLTNNKVSQSNRLIEASHTLTLNEKRLVLCAASMLDSRKPLPKNGFITVTADAFADTFGIETRHAYESLNDAATRLYNRDLRRMKNGQVIERMRWVYHVKYKDGLGCVELGFSPTILPHLTMLHAEFTSYQLRQIGHLSSFYSIRLYELMAQFHKIGKRDCTLEQLREMFDTGEKYKDVKDFRKWVLDPALKEVNSHTDLRIDSEPKRAGRKIIGFSFMIQKSEQLSLAI